MAKLTELNLKAVKGLTRSNQFVIFFPKRSGRITINEFPMLRTTISDLKFNLLTFYQLYADNGCGCCVNNKEESNLTYPNTIQNGKISKRTEALIGKCFSSLVMVSEANVKALLSKVNWNVTCTISNNNSSRTSSIFISLW